MRSTKCCATAVSEASLCVCRVIASATLVLALVPAPSAQETTLRSRSNLVLVPTLVKDHQGAIVYGLHADDFIIEDDGIQVASRLDEAPEGQPISLVLAIQK